MQIRDMRACMHACVRGIVRAEGVVWCRVASWHRYHEAFSLMTNVQRITLIAEPQSAAATSYAKMVVSVMGSTYR